MNPPVKVLVVLGTRPEAVKLAPVILELRRSPEKFVTRLAVTAQHREIMDEVLSTFGIAPDHDMGIMTEGQTPTQVASKALAGLETIILQEKPDALLVEGDTVTCFAGSLAAFYNRVAVGHVEAGLRTYDRWQPFPEEINRRLTTAVADMHFAPTQAARDNLLKEGVPAEGIFLTGNTVIDALAMVKDRTSLTAELAGLTGKGRLLLVTAHRRENWGEPLRQICLALRDLAENFEDVQIVYAVHPHPRVQEVVRAALEGVERVMLVDFPRYMNFVALLKEAYLVLTDSGGVQEEAPGLGKPVLVLRETTERPEGVAAGVAVLCGANRKKIVGEASRLLTEREAYLKMARAVNPYGDGRASQRIRQALEYFFGLRKERPTEFRSMVHV